MEKSYSLVLFAFISALFAGKPGVAAKDPGDELASVNGMVDRCKKSVHRLSRRRP